MIKPDSEERRQAMFKDNKLRLMLTLVGFMRLGAHDDPDASWMIPSTLTSKDLQEAIELIRKYEFDPPTYDDGKGPEDMVRSKAAAARRKVDWDDDDDGIDEDEDEDRGEYTMDGPTVRKAGGSGKKVLKRHRRTRTPVELDDEEKQARADVRRKREIEKQQKVKSTIFIHDSDEEDDPEADAAFFAREEELRAQTRANNAEALALATTEPIVSKKRKADTGMTERSKRKRTPPKRKAGPFGSHDSDSEDSSHERNESVSSRAPSEERQSDLNDSEDEATDTPLSSQLAGGIDMSTKPTILAASKDSDVAMVDVDDDDDDDEIVVVRRPAARSMRAGFVIDSDSD